MSIQVQANWKQVLAKHCRLAWRDAGKAIILARVPALLAEENIDISSLLNGRRLRPFLQAEGSDELQLVQSESNPIVWGVLPKDVIVHQPNDQYLPRSNGDRPLRFAPAVWKAFTSPLATGMRRWLIDEPTPHFRDLPEGDIVESGHLISPQFIAGLPPDSEVDIAHTIARIGQWAAEHQFDTRRLATNRKKTPVPKTDSDFRASGTHLDRLLSLLLTSELTRISMPLDIVARLSAERRELDV